MVIIFSCDVELIGLFCLSSDDVADATRVPQSASSSDTSPLNSSPNCGATAHPSKPVDINVQVFLFVIYYVRLV